MSSLAPPVEPSVYAAAPPLEAAAFETKKYPGSIDSEDTYAFKPIPEYEGLHRFDPEAKWTPEEEAKVVRKIDARIMSFACLLFFALQLDRGNIGSALSGGMLTDIGVDTNVYNNGMAIFYCSFLFAELPSQMIGKRIGPDRWVPIQVMSWSIITVFQCLIKDKGTFYATRCLLGLFEGGLIPDMILLLSYFYTSTELPIRLSFFWATLTGTNIIQSLMAAGILSIKGPWSSWRYLFAIEGAITFCIGLSAVFYLPASPTQTAGGLRGKDGWFTAREETIMVNRVLRDSPDKGLMHNRQHLSWKDFKACLLDYDNYPLYLIGLTAYIPFSPPASYLTLTIRSLGFSTFHTNLLVIPSSVLWILNIFALTWLSKKLKEKTFVSMIAQVWGFVLLIAVITLKDGGREWIRYAIVSLLVAYPYSHPILVSWNSSNSNSVRLRTVSASLYNISVQLGSIVSTQIYRAPDKPYYHTGNKALLGIVCFNLVLFPSVKGYFILRNRQKRRAWTALTVDEQRHYREHIAPTAGNKSLLFEFGH